ncbi:SIR2 family protein [Paraburkholderia sp. NPDC080076]|uniref:SIR2 family protein n=1 Tax=Paraburkholderia sp. NPDC080076 TaxID=3390605 RepID=UPI003CFC833F
MSRLLLLGAGFSRNWGGWLASEVFEYLLGCQEVNMSSSIRDLLWKCQQDGTGFEGALAELQEAVRIDPERRTELQSLEASVSAMFREMNRGFSKINIDDNGPVSKSLRTFLSLFEAIFTLNQDSLLEYQYLDVINRSRQRNPQEGRRVELPAMRVPEQNLYFDPQPGLPWTGRWVPVSPDEFEVDPRTQPYFKLHGSANWQDGNGGSMLIMGGNKVREIELSPVLQWYQQQFEEYLSSGNSRLMVIGYGFRDRHINDVIKRAVLKNNLKLFIVTPDGSSQAEKVADFDPDLGEVFKIGLTGASRRPLRETLASQDSVEFSKLFRFLS